MGIIEILGYIVQIIEDVILAQARIHTLYPHHWIPAFAGMTGTEYGLLRLDFIVTRNDNV